MHWRAHHPRVTAKALRRRHLQAGACTKCSRRVANFPMRQHLSIADQMLQRVSSWRGAALGSCCPRCFWALVGSLSCREASMHFGHANIYENRGYRHCMTLSWTLSLGAFVVALYRLARPSRQTRASVPPQHAHTHLFADDWPIQRLICRMQTRRVECSHHHLCTGSGASSGSSVRSACAVLTHHLKW